MYVISFLSESFFVRTTLGCSSQSKRFESCIGVLIDLVRAAVVDYPLQHIQVTIAGCTRACRCIPRAALASEPLQYLQVTTPGCTFARPSTPRAAFAPEPLQYLQLPILGYPVASACTPRAALAPEPLQYLQIATPARPGKEFPIQLEPLLGFQQLQGLQLASLRCEQ